jgi:hypothetical protein
MRLQASVNSPDHIQADLMRHKFSRLLYDKTFLKFEIAGLI